MRENTDHNNSRYRHFLRSEMKAKNKERYSFSKSLSQNFEVLSPRGDAINPKMGQKDQNGSFTNIDRKVKMKSKRYFEVNYSFMKPFS